MTIRILYTLTFTFLLYLIALLCGCESSVPPPSKATYRVSIWFPTGTVVWEGIRIAGSLAEDNTVRFVTKEGKWVATTLPALVEEE